MKTRHAAALALAIVTLTAAIIGAASPVHAQAVNYGALCTNINHKTKDGSNLTFIFIQDGEEIENLSNFGFFLKDGFYANGLMEGSISSTGIEFKGTAGNHCTVTGSGSGENWALSGKYRFHGKCAKFFGDGKFSNATIACFVSFDAHAEYWQADKKDGAAESDE